MFLNDGLSMRPFDLIKGQNKCAHHILTFSIAHTVHHSHTIFNIPLWMNGKSNDIITSRSPHTNSIHQSNVIKAAPHHATPHKCVQSVAEYLIGFRCDVAALLAVDQSGGGNFFGIKIQNELRSFGAGPFRLCEIQLDKILWRKMCFCSLFACLFVQKGSQHNRNEIHISIIVILWAKHVYVQHFHIITSATLNPAASHAPVTNIPINSYNDSVSNIVIFCSLSLHTNLHTGTMLVWMPNWIQSHCEMQSAWWQV